MGKRNSSEEQDMEKIKESMNKRNDAINEAKGKGSKCGNNKKDGGCCGKELEELQEKIKLLEEQNLELKNDYVRVMADFDNYRKRKEKEMGENREAAIVGFVEDLLPAIDNFEMSLKMTDNKEMFVKGVEMIHKNLLDTLRSNNIEEFYANEGEDFDPYLHEPILIEDKSKEPGKVVNSMNKGYKFKDKIIRPVKVQVVKDRELDDIDDNEKSSE